MRNVSCIIFLFLSLTIKNKCDIIVGPEIFQGILPKKKVPIFKSFCHFIFWECHNRVSFSLLRKVTTWMEVCSICLIWSDPNQMLANNQVFWPANMNCLHRNHYKVEEWKMTIFGKICYMYTQNSTFKNRYWETYRFFS